MVRGIFELFLFIIYQQVDLLKRLSGNVNANKLFIKYVIYVLCVALIMTILYLCYFKISTAMGNFI